MKCRAESAVKWAVNAELSIFATDNNTSSNAKPKQKCIFLLISWKGL